MKYSLSIITCLCVILFSACSDALGIDIKPGDIISAQHDNVGSILKIDPLTGDRTLISQWGVRGDGPPIWRSTSVLIEPSGSLIVADRRGVLQVDLETGDRSVISHPGRIPIFDDPGIPMRGTGPLNNPESVHLASNGDLILVNAGSGSGGFITSIDRATGNRSLLSGLGKGDGPQFSSLNGSILISDERLLVAETKGVITEVDLLSGDRSVFSSAFAHPSDITMLENGDIYVLDYSLGDDITDSLVKIDPTNGSKEVISTIPTFPIIGYGSRLIPGNDFSILTGPAGFIYQVDPLTGDRTVISSETIGNGPSLFWGDIVVVPVPEPNAFYLFLVGGIVLLSFKYK